MPEHFCTLILTVDYVVSLVSPDNEKFSKAILELIYFS